MAIDFSDTIGWPAESSPTGPDVGQLPDWRIRYNEARRQRRREQCRAAHKRWLERTKEDHEITDHDPNDAGC
jgi:hypothetical protein